MIHEYEKAVEEMKIEMEKKLSYHEKNPENHPMYPDEWKKFWNRRFKELQIEGKDPSTYDFKPEWILSWSKRMQEIHDEEINERTEKLKNKIFGDVNLNKSSSESPSRDSSPQRDKKPIGDSKNSWHHSLGPEVVEREHDINKPLNDKKPKVAGASPINSDSEDSMNELNDQNKPREKIQIENPLNVITVLRQLSVLENQLGLLAPKVVELLSKGLVMEKLEPKSSIKLLTPDNCVMFETVKEKLKGQLLAGVVKRSLVNATMFSIRNIEKLMQLAPKFVPTMKMLNATLTPTPTPIPTPISKPTPIIVPGVGVIDKLAIAQQITQALLAQGKENVTQDELETLITAVVGMAKFGDNMQGAKNLISNLNNCVDEMKTTLDKKEEVEKKNLDQLSQGDIINLLKNFRDLTTDEQDGLITYLKTLWEKNPDEVKKFRKYIDMGPSNLKEVTSMFKEEDDDDNYELSDVCKAVKEKVSEQKDEDLNEMTVNFEITEEQQKLLSSIQNFLPEIKSDYSLQPTNSQLQSNHDQSLYKSPTIEPYNTSYSLDPYSAKKPDTNIYSQQPSTSAASVPFIIAQDQHDLYNKPQDQSTVHNKPQEQPNKYNIPQEQPNKYNIPQEQPSVYKKPQEQPNKYNIPHEQPDRYNLSQEHPIKYNTPLEQSGKYNLSQEHPNKYNIPLEQHSKYNVSQEKHNKLNTSQEQPNNFNTSEEEPNEYNIPQEEPDPYSANQVDSYNDPYSQNCGNNYYQRQPDKYYKYQQNTQVSTYTSSGGYYKGNNTYKGNTNNTYALGTPKDKYTNSRYNHPPSNNRFQNRH